MQNTSVCKIPVDHVRTVGASVLVLRHTRAVDANCSGEEENPVPAASLWLALGGFHVTKSYCLILGDW